MALRVNRSPLKKQIFDALFPKAVLRATESNAILKESRNFVNRLSQSKSVKYDPNVNVYERLYHNASDQEKRKDVVR